MGRRSVRRFRRQLLSPPRWPHILMPLPAVCLAAGAASRCPAQQPESGTSSRICPAPPPRRARSRRREAGRDPSRARTLFRSVRARQPPRRRLRPTHHRTHRADTRARTPPRRPRPNRRRHRAAREDPRRRPRRPTRRTRTGARPGAAPTAQGDPPTAHRGDHRRLAGRHPTHVPRTRGSTSASNDGASRDRTGDLLHAMQALSQLSYGPLLRSKSRDSSLNSSAQLTPIFCLFRLGASRSWTWLRPEILAAGRKKQRSSSLQYAAIPSISSAVYVRFS